MNLSLRDISDELYQEIKILAERERRSINQQIVILLEQSIRQQKFLKVRCFEHIDQTREIWTKRVNIMPDSVIAIAEDRNR
ncbi:hypothetical protein C7H19_22720 [Aphanothece hegewaldii CCALA 016]|uniref:Uncharacterized protein n=1 Tax=Aphanothece hegewaldii CCALA 016 TaxID=2107694 RepID=A0A2T1LRM4_9CHRO|nr:hypothetical protein [Aphanothece hegewaldii]PSF31394.1 hypothetical protein C7H19_22720 [Aphanothece hegewaldii CCALA 016]